jgi:hypothetical protein
MTIETKNFIATASDIQKLAGAIIDGEQQGARGRGTYLKALIATTQAELGAAPRVRNGKGEKLSEKEVDEHLKALQKVFNNFHAAVLHVAKNTLPDPDAKLIRQRTGFSRSAGSTVRGFIRAGGDIRAVAAHRATKAALATPRTRRRISPEALQSRAQSLGSQLEQIVKSLNAVDKVRAQAVLAPILARLAQATGTTARGTRNPRKAIAERIPLHAKGGIFVPIPANGHTQRLNG